jgi:hypothetical protein
MAAAPAAISTEVDGQRIMIIVAATNAIATNAGIVRRLMASLRLLGVNGSFCLFGSRKAVDASKACTLFVGTALEPHAAFREGSR